MYIYVVLTDTLDAIIAFRAIFKKLAALWAIWCEPMVPEENPTSQQDLPNPRIDPSKVMPSPSWAYWHQQQTGPVPISGSPSLDSNLSSAVFVKATKVLKVLNLCVTSKHDMNQNKVGLERPISQPHLNRQLSQTPPIQRKIRASVKVHEVRPSMPLVTTRVLDRASVQGRNVVIVREIVAVGIPQAQLTQLAVSAHALRLRYHKNSQNA